MNSDKQLPSSISLGVSRYPVYFAFFLLWGTLFHLNNTLIMSLFLAAVLSTVAAWSNRPDILSIDRSEHSLELIKFALADRYNVSYSSEKQMYFRPSSLLWQFFEIPVIVEIEQNRLVLQGGMRRLDQLRNRLSK